MTIRSRESTTPKPEKSYTFTVSVSFEMEFTFRESEVQPAEEGGENDIDPTDEALADLESELKEYLSQEYPIEKIEAFADFDSLLGVDEVPATSKAIGKTVMKPALGKPAKRRRSNR